MSRSTGEAAFASLTEKAIMMMPSAPLREFELVYDADAVNRESDHEPPAARQHGPDGFHATALWLRSAFSDLEFTVDAIAVDDDLAVTWGFMAGRHTGTFTTWRPDGEIARAFPPTGRSFRVQQAHFVRARGGRIVEHWAVRDDTGLADQLGWMPPGPAYLVRSSLATASMRRQLRSGRATARPEG